MELSTNEIKVLNFLTERNDFVREDEIKIPGLDQREISSAVSWLEAKGLIYVKKEEKIIFSIGPEGEKFLKDGLPEEILYNKMKTNNKIDLREINNFMGPNEVKIALAQLGKYGIKPLMGSLIYTPNTDLETAIKARKQFLKYVKMHGTSPDTGMIEHFRKRGDVLIEKKKLDRSVSINDDGRRVLKENVNSNKIEALTPEIISSGIWKNQEFRGYDMSVPVERINGGFYHPLTILTRRIKRIFLEMGFSEMPGHYIESAAWNMDALFVPQDHPVREMQDTFYVKPEGHIEIEYPEIIEKVKKTHERGIRGYTGWGYSFNPEESKRFLMRTHTTVSTVRYLYSHPVPPVAIFSIEKVFRHESVDWKHLAELHQIEGAYYAKDASLSTLKSLMRSFYGKLGFTDIKFIPSYYPYTEPSMDAVAYINGKEMELGGSGVFRTEVTKPLGLKEPVIAWGMGLERIAMVFYKLNDIREIYQSDIEWLQNYRIPGNSY